MNCGDARPLVDAFLDGELELSRQLEVEAHLEVCAACARSVEARRALQSALRTSDLYYRAPADLEQRVRKSLPAPRRVVLLRRYLWPALAAAALMVLAVTGVTLLRPRQSATDMLAVQIVSGHVRSLQPGHLTDVLSSDQHTVKPWFAGRVDFSPPVVDLRAQGFPLAGGRLDSVGGRTVVALVYQRRQHVINLFAWPATGAQGPLALHANGYTIVWWNRGGFAGWAVSDLNSVELEQFARLILDRIS